MGQRRLEADRCEGCGLHRPLCACDERPALTLRTRVLVVQNNKERGKPTSTGRMIVQVLKNGGLIYYGARDQPWDGAALTLPEHDYFLIFPRVDDPEGPAPRPAPLLTAERIAARRAARPEATPTLVILDGTWAQCSRMSRRVPELAAMEAWSLPEGPGSHWGVRTTNDPTRLCSYEATVRLIELFEGPEPALVMQRYFDVVTARMLHMKTKLPSPEVPASWIEDRRRRFGRD